MRRLAILSCYALAYLWEQRFQTYTQLHFLMEREMEKAASDSSYSVKRLQSAMAVRHFLGQFLIYFHDNAWGVWNDWERKLRDPQTLSLWDRWIVDWEKHPGAPMEEMFQSASSFFPQAPAADSSSPTASPSKSPE